MMSDLDGSDHPIDATLTSQSGADRQQDFPASQRDTPATDTPTPVPDSTDQTPNTGDNPQRNPEQIPTSDVPHGKLRDAAGYDYTVSGDPEGCLRYNHQQGDNDLGFQGTCGLCSVQDIVDQYGQNMTENDVVHFAADHHLCTTDGSPDQCGGTSISTQAEILLDMHILAQPCQHMQVDELASLFESGHKIILETNAGELFQGILPDQDCAQMLGPDPHAFNHAVVLTGVVRDPQTGAVVGVFINDTGANKGAQFIDAAHLQQAWVGTGGQCVVAYGPVDGQVPTQPPTVDPQNVAPQEAQPQVQPQVAPSQPQPYAPQEAQPQVQPQAGLTQPQSYVAQPTDPQSFPSPNSAPADTPTAAPLYSPTPQNAEPSPIILPTVIPRGDAPADSPTTPENEKHSMMPAIVLPIVAFAALRARIKTKSKS